MQLVSTEEYSKYQRLSLALAESREKASFHCRTVNCPGWCIYEDYVNSFLCQVCAKENCLVCKAQHEGKNCRQYQDDFQQRARTDMNAKLTLRFLEVRSQTCVWWKLCFAELSSCFVAVTLSCWVYRMDGDVLISNKSRMVTR